MLKELVLLAASASSLQGDLQKVADQLDGRLGACVWNLVESKPTCVHGDQRFPLQSVMKMVVAAAVLDAADRNVLRISDRIVVRPQDASPGPQDFAKRVRAKGQLEVSIEDLMRYAVIDSDSTAVDVLIKHLGGISFVQDFLRRKGVEGISIDREERHVQADSVGLSWRDEYADYAKFEKAMAALSDHRRDAATEAFLKDVRDTATPIAMTAFLKDLASGRLLSKGSTDKLIAIMSATATGKDRLRAGLPKGWRLAHKTGTGRPWRGLVSATNDVGILMAPDGGKIAVTVFISGSRQPNKQRAAVIARVASLAAESHDPRNVK